MYSKRAIHRCVCGMRFTDIHRLRNHIGHAILRDDNAEKHEPDKKTKPLYDSLFKRDD